MTVKIGQILITKKGEKENLENCSKHHECAERKPGYHLKKREYGSFWSNIKCFPSIHGPQRNELPDFLDLLTSDLQRHREMDINGTEGNTLSTDGWIAVKFAADIRSLLKINCTDLLPTFY